MSQFLGTPFTAIYAKLRDWGIEELNDKINKLKEVEFLQFLNP